MQTVLVFAVALLVAVLLSGAAHRSVLSTALVFVGVGFGAHALGWIEVPMESPIVGELVEIAIVVTLFKDGLELGFQELKKSWRLPGRALLVGLPLTFLAIAALARVLLGIDWTRALLVGAILSPTDPVFAAALIGSERVPLPVRRLLNVESGMNDGLALPLVLFLLRGAEGGKAPILATLISVVTGIGIGAAVPFVAVFLYRAPIFGAAPAYRPLFSVAILLTAWSLADLVGGNPFLAAFASGIIVATISPKARRSIRPAGSSVSELVKLAALLAFIGSIEPEGLFAFGWRGALLTAGALLVARPVAIMVALIRSGLGWKERLAAAWFGPKGFACVLFGLLLLSSNVPGRAELFGVIALVTTVSIVLHSTTDVLVSRWFASEEDEEASERAVEDVARAGA